MSDQVRVVFRDCLKIKRQDTSVFVVAIVVVVFFLHKHLNA